MGLNMQGAAAGAAAGSSFGPWGTAIGAGVGAMSGGSGGGGGMFGGNVLGGGGGLPFAIPDKFNVDHSGWNVNFGDGDITSSDTDAPDDSLAGALGFNSATGLNLNVIILVFGALIALKIVMGKK